MGYSNCILHNYIFINLFCYFDQDEEAPDIDFLYADEDDFSSEIAELYSYTEGPEFALAHKAFEDATIKFNLPTAWGYEKSRHL